MSRAATRVLPSTMFPPPGDRMRSIRLKVNGMQFTRSESMAQFAFHFH
jgi:hypothetical protein